MAKRRSKRAAATPPGVALFQMMTGKWISKAISTVVELGIPDHLGKGARTAGELARQSGASEDGVYRLLRALASVGVFAETGGRRFRLTPIGQLLRSDARESHAGYAHLTGHDSTWRPWGEMTYSVKTGQPAFDKVFGMPVFEYFCEKRRGVGGFRRGDDVAQHE